MLVRRWRNDWTIPHPRTLWPYESWGNMHGGTDVLPLFAMPRVVQSMGLCSERLSWLEFLNEHSDDIWREVAVQPGLTKELSDFLMGRDKDRGAQRRNLQTFWLEEVRTIQ